MNILVEKTIRIFNPNLFKKGTPLKIKFPNENFWIDAFVTNHDDNGITISFYNGKRICVVSIPSVIAHRYEFKFMKVEE
ncbi:hypothetical protein QO179_24250 [Bacillus stercoris]|nr:hypothetical protein [Bacillus stercoris]